MLREITLTFAPSLLYAITSVILVIGVRWTQRRKARPGFTPLWLMACGLLLIAGVTVAGLYVHGFRGTGRHRRPFLRPIREGGTG